jgi:hypothetical protein
MSLQVKLKWRHPSPLLTVSRKTKRENKEIVVIAALANDWMKPRANIDDRKKAWSSIAIISFFNVLPHIACSGRMVLSNKYLILNCFVFVLSYA